MTETTLADLMRDGGWVMWLLLAASVAVVAVSIQRGLAIRRSQGSARRLLLAVRKGLQNGQTVQELARRCTTLEGSVGRMVGAGLSRWAQGREETESHLEAVALAELRRLGRGLGVLAAVAMTAPLLGFLGTVTGMMASFGTIVDFGTSRPDLVAGGISEALTTTAAGLVVALPAQLLFQGLSARVDRIEGELEAAANGLLDLLHHPTH